ncbi:MAG: alpha/beta hydrolase family protein [Rubrobacteridae bacterium]|nr:alpha/beta hydrolase family protein [Rubrobacteridae bacterium]
MKRIASQIIDKFALSAFTPPLFIADEVYSANKSLAITPILPPSAVGRIPKVFNKTFVKPQTFEISHFTFESQMRTGSSKNNIVHGYHYHLTNNPAKSTIVLLHGLCERSYRHINRYAQNLVDNGHDCITMALPYHLERSDSNRTVAGQLMGPDLRAMLEGFQQAIKDLVNIINWLVDRGNKNVGVLGINAGAYIAAMASSISQKIGFSILLAPLSSPIQSLGFDVICDGCRSSENLFGLSAKQLSSLLEPWELFNIKPIVDEDKIMLAAATHSSFLPYKTTLKLWREWGKPEMKEYGIGYMGLRRSKQVIEDVVRFIDHNIIGNQAILSN